MKEAQVVMAILMTRRESLMLRLENHSFRNTDPQHDEARLSEVDSLLQIFKKLS